MLAARRQIARPYSSAAAALRRTPLYDFHVQHNAKLVDFAGWEMPLLYSGQTHMESHRWVRAQAGLFDVSHMLQHSFSGPEAAKFLEKITPADLQALQPFSSTLSVLLNDQGGIVDDLMITKHADDHYYVVTNAGRRDEDLAFFKEQSKLHNLSGFKHEHIAGGLVALQGPKAAEVLAKLTPYDLKTISFGEAAFLPILGERCHVARGGYTGEDGFEVSLQSSELTNSIANALCEDEAVRPIGLAARDSLRLEAGLCLYGHDLNDQVSPIAARLAWTIGKARRQPHRADFNGAEKVLAELAAKKSNLRTGLISKGPAPREGSEVLDEQGNTVGVVTSGSLAPSLGHNIAMAYLPRSLTKAGTKLQIVVRGKPRPAETCTMPFVPTHYYRRPDRQ